MAAVEVGSDPALVRPLPDFWIGCRSLAISAGPATALSAGAQRRAAALTLQRNEGLQNTCWGLYMSYKRRGRERRLVHPAAGAGEQRCCRRLALP